MKRKYITVFIVLACGIAGIVLSYILAQHFYFDDIFVETGEQLSVFSDISSRVCGDGSIFLSCAKVEESAWSLFLGIPLAAWGMIYYTMVFFFALFCFFIREELQRLHFFLMLLLLCTGAVVSIILLVISIAVIKALCPLCCAVYAAAVIQLVIFIFYYKKNAPRFRQVSPDLIAALKSNTGYTVLLPLLMALAVLPALAIDHHLRLVKEEYGQRQDDVKLTNLAMSVCSQQPVYLNLKPYCVIGDINAPVVIAEFSDFMCPFCSKVAVILDEIMAEYPSKVALAFVNYPLDMSCNRNIRKDVHPGACVLAKGALAAALRGKFGEYMRIVFSTGNGRVTAEELAGIAAAAGMDPAVFLSDIRSPLIDERLQEQISSAVANGVRSTPTLFINGRILNHRPSKKLLKKIIECELKKLNK